MSTSYPSATPQPQEPKKDNRGLIYGLLIAALLGTWGYIIFDKSETKKEMEKNQIAYNSLDSVRNQLQKDYEEAEFRLDRMMGENAKLDSLLRTRDKDNEEMKNKIKNLIYKQNATQKDLAEARRLISEYNGKIQGYEQEISKLKEENQQLTNANQTLTTQKQELETSLATTQTEKKDLEQKVDVGSTLVASNFKIDAVNIKNSGKEKATDVAKRADKFKISFDVENRLSTSGTKDLYVVVTTPDGKVVTEEGLGSGSISTREEGQRNFTNKVSIDYEQGKKKNVSFDLKQADKYKPGSYRVEVFQNGFKIGEGNCNLKKGGLFS